MPTESGDMKLLGNFRKLIDHVSGETTYKPSNDILKPAGLEAQYTAAQAATRDVPANMAAYKAAINDASRPTMRSIGSSCARAIKETEQG